MEGGVDGDFEMAAFAGVSFVCSREAENDLVFVQFVSCCLRLLTCGGNGYMCEKIDIFL